MKPLTMLSGLMEEAQRKVKEMNTRCRMWGEANPVVRYAECELREK